MAPPFNEDSQSPSLAWLLDEPGGVGLRRGGPAGAPPLSERTVVVFTSDRGFGTTSACRYTVTYRDPP